MRTSFEFYTGVLSLGGTQADEGDQQSAGERRCESCPNAGLAPPADTASLATS